MQDVLTASYNAILTDDRPINVQSVALPHRAQPLSESSAPHIGAVGVDSMDIHFAEQGASTADKVHEREEFRQLVDDIRDLPETQRTALVLREMDALSYEQIAEAMETTVSSVKSLLVRARVSLTEAAEARLLTCEEVREELAEVAEGLQPQALPARSAAICAAAGRLRQVFHGADAAHQSRTRGAGSQSARWRCFTSSCSSPTLVATRRVRVQATGAAATGAAGATGATGGGGERDRSDDRRGRDGRDAAGAWQAAAVSGTAGGALGSSGRSDLGGRRRAWRARPPPASRRPRSSPPAACRSASHTTHHRSLPVAERYRRGGADPLRACTPSGRPQPSLTIATAYKLRASPTQGSASRGDRRRTEGRQQQDCSCRRHDRQDAPAPTKASNGSRRFRPIVKKTVAGRYAEP